MINLPAKTCLACAKAIKGRSDKKFCDDYCRSAHNNSQNSLSSNYSRNVIHALQRNKRILLHFLAGQASVKINRDRLLLRGFLFHYHTHTLEIKKGHVYKFCFETGYTALGNEKLLVIKREEEL